MLFFLLSLYNPSNEWRHRLTGQNTKIFSIQITFLWNLIIIIKLKQCDNRMKSHDTFMTLNYLYGCIMSNVIAGYFLNHISYNSTFQIVYSIVWLKIKKLRILIDSIIYSSIKLLNYIIQIKENIWNKIWIGVEVFS